MTVQHMVSALTWVGLHTDVAADATPVEESRSQIPHQIRLQTLEIKTLIQNSVLLVDRESKRHTCFVHMYSEWWWWLFPHLWGLGENVQPFIAYLQFFVVVFGGDQFAHINSTLYAKIGQQWLSEFRQLWPSVPSRIVHELVSLTGSLTMPGQWHSLPTPTLLGQGCMQV